jgi:hypothetical protein
MQASADALNAYARTVPYDPARPPVLFGALGLGEFKIAFDEVFDPGTAKRVWVASRSRFETVFDPEPHWEIVPRIVVLPDGESNVWTVPVPGPLPLLGAATAFGFSRKLRKRIKGSESLQLAGAID